MFVCTLYYGMLDQLETFVNFQDNHDENELKINVENALMFEVEELCDYRVKCFAKTRKID